MRRTSLQWIAGIAVLFVVSVGLTQAWAGWFSVAWDATRTDIYGNPVTALVGYHLCWEDSAGGARCLDVGNQTTYPLTDLPGNLTYTLWVTASDTAGNVSGPSNTLTVPVPLAEPDTASTQCGTPVAIEVLRNDPLPDTLTITTVSQGLSGGTVAINSNGTVTYTPATSCVSTDFFEYTIMNEPGAFAKGTVTVTVTSVNHQPLAGADAASTPVETPITLNVLANDTDADGNRLTLVPIPPGTRTAHGTISSSGNSVTYTPAANYVGTDFFEYTVTDGLGASAKATVTITVFVLLQLEADAGSLQAPMQVGTETATPAVQYVWVPSGVSPILNPMQTGGASQYPFTVPQTDTYVVWGRVSPSTTGTGSFFLGLDAPAGNGLITDISPTTYQVATLHVGSTYYIDTTATITALPSGWDGLEIIKTENAAKRNKQDTLLTFTLLQDATLYVAYDASVSVPPRWLTDSYTKTGQRIETTNGPLALWQQHVPAGRVILPGNKYQTSGPGRSQYVVVVAPYFVWDVTPPPAASASPQAWRWEQAASNTTPVFLLDPGPHTLTIRQRESGTRLDKLVITNNLNLVPQP